MKKLLHKWRGLQVAAAIAATTLAAHGAPQVQTLGGGPNQLSPARSGSANGDTLNAAKFNNPNAVAIDADGNLYIADRSNNKVRKITRPGNADSLTSTFVQRLKAPVGVAVDASNRIYVVTYSDGRLQVFNSSGSLQRSVSGLVKPTALALDEGGNVYVTEFIGNVKRIAPDNTVTLIASGFVKLQGIALLHNGLLAVSEMGNHAIYTVDPSNGTTTLIAGHNGPGYSDGPGIGAQFNKPYGLATAPNGSLVVADRANHRVRVINTNNVVTTLYGVARQQWIKPFVGWADGEGGSGGVAAAHDPIGVTVGTNGTVYATEIYWDLIRQVTTTGLAITNPPTGTNGSNVFVILAMPTFTPISGYFPFGVDITVNSTSPVFYTTDGTEPTTNSRQVQLTGNVGTLRFSDSLRDLTSLRLKALTTNGASATVSGLPAGVNQFGIPRDSVAGSGSTIVIPVVANLRAGDRIQSFQYRVRITPQNGAPPILPYFRASSVSQNDFIPLVTAAAAGSVARISASLLPPFGNVRELVVSASGTNANVDFQNFAATAMLVVPIDSSAVEGQSYQIDILYPSATSDGYQLEVPVTTGPSRTITIASVPYLVGDVAPGRGYNAGEFGDGDLRNNDANAVLFASVGLRRPFEFTDAFNAMDAFPPEPSAAGGDGVVEFADWQVVLNRSLRLDPNNWSRRWIDGGIIQSDPVGFAAAPSPSKSVAKSAAKAAVSPGPGEVWLHGATLNAGNVYNAAPGVCEVPVSISVAPGYTVAGLCFRVVVEAEGGAAPVANVSFTSMLGNEAFQSMPGNSPNDIVCAWTMVPSPAFSLQGDNLLGKVRFNIPAQSLVGQHYTVRFIRPSGAADWQTAVSFDSVPGSAWVLSTPPPPAETTAGVQP